MNEHPLRPYPPPSDPPADLDRRLYAYVIDRMILWGSYAAAIGLALAQARAATGFAFVVAAVLVVNGLFAAGLGFWGTSPGRVVMGIRVIGVNSGAPIGLPAALVRSLILGLAAAPTAGLGLAVLAWTAASDPGGRRRGWHDVHAGTVAIDIRGRVPDEEIDVLPAPLVNLTQMRLLPGTATDVHHEIPAAGSGVRERPSPTAPDAGTWRVAFDTGEAFVVEGLALVGRDPEPQGREAVRHLVALESADMSISKIHAQFERTPQGSLVLMDRGSTNGTSIVRQGVAKPLSPGRPTTLLAGDMVRFGDRMMTVDRS